MLACPFAATVVSTFQIRMKTAEDLKRFIEGFSGDVSADNALQVSVIGNGLYIPT